jgi:hypothetical protein
MMTIYFYATLPYLHETSIFQQSLFQMYNFQFVDTVFLESNMEL